MGTAPTGSGLSGESKKHHRRFCFEEREEEEDEDEKEESDPRRLLGPSTGKPLYRGRIEAGSVCPENLADKLRTAFGRAPVGFVRMLASTTGTGGGLLAALRGAHGLAGLKILYEQHGGELSINLDQGEDARLLEATIGECNNADRNFHEPGADAKTAKVHRASQAAIKLTDSGTGVFEKNINDGGCAPHFDAAGDKHCDLLKDYTPEQREAMRNTALVAYDKVFETFPATEVLLVERFGNFQKIKHRRRDGTPVVTMEAATATGMVVLSVVVKHLSLAPGDTDALLSIVEGRSALKAAGVRALEWRKGTLDLEGLLADYTDADRINGVLDLLHILVTAEQEPAEYRESLRVEKTKEMVQIITT